MVKKICYKISSWFTIKPKTSGLITFVTILALVFVVVSLRYKIIKENEHREMSNVLEIVHQNIEQVLKNSNTITLTLAMTINDKGEPKDFNKIGAKLISSNNAIDAVQLVPNGVIKYIYPLKGNEAAMNYDILNSKDVRQEAKKSIKSKSIYFAGPLKLKQGGTAVIGRLPIFKNNTFWGFSAVIIRLETLIKSSGIQKIDKSKYYFQMSKKNPVTGKEEFFFENKSDFSKNYFQSISIPDGNWKLYIISTNKNGAFNQLYTSSILGFLLAIMFAVWVYTILKKPAELQKLILKQAEKLINSEVEFKILFDQAPVGIAKIETLSGKFLEVNKEYCNITGYSEDELKKLTFKEVTHKDDLNDDLENMQKLIEGKINEFSIEKRYINKLGKIVWINLIVAPLWKKGEKIKNHIAIIEDINEKIDTEHNLKKSFDLVNEQNKRLLNFSYIVSHNLRSHSSNINSISNLLEDSEDEDEKKELTSMLNKVSISLNETMSNLNDVVNIQSNLHLTKENLNLNNYINATVNIISEQINSKGATIINTIEDDVVVKYSPAYLESILLNFISNSLKYSHPDRKPVIELSFDKSKNELKITDNGLGIDLEKYGSSLFGMYKTFHKNKDAKGIGLFITKNQIEAMGGKVSVESKVDFGSTFTIEFL